MKTFFFAKKAYISYLFLYLSIFATFSNPTLALDHPTLGPLPDKITYWYTKGPEYQQKHDLSLIFTGDYLSVNGLPINSHIILFLESLSSNPEWIEHSPDISTMIAAIAIAHTFYDGNPLLALPNTSISPPTINNGVLTVTLSYLTDSITIELPSNMESNWQLHLTSATAQGFFSLESNYETEAKLTPSSNNQTTQERSPINNKSILLFIN